MLYVGFVPGLGATFIIRMFYTNPIMDGSICQGSMLEVGMRIYKVNGKSFSTFHEGATLLKSTDGQLSLTVEKPPSIAIGTIYTIQRGSRKDNNRMNIQIKLRLR